jgi:hypothetical protein
MRKSQQAKLALKAYIAVLKRRQNKLSEEEYQRLIRAVLIELLELQPALGTASKKTSTSRSKKRRHSKGKSKRRKAFNKRK